MAKKNKRGLLDRLMMGSEKSEDFARASLPSNRWELFWDIFKGRFGKLIIINLLVFLFCLPFIALLLFRTMSISAYGTTYPFSQGFGVGYGAYPTMAGWSESIVFMVNATLLIFTPVAFFIAAIGIAGGAYVIRNMVWTEGIFVANDFWRGIRKNFKQILIVLLMYSLVFYITFLAISLSDKNLAQGMPYAWIYNVIKVIAYVLIIIFSVMTLHMITMSVTYNLKLRHLIKNSFVFTFALLPNNVLFLFLGAIPFLLLLFDGFLMIIGMLLIFLMGFSHFLLVWTNYCQWGYDKFLNDKVKGAQKNKGIYAKVKGDNSEALKRYKEQLAMVKPSSLSTKPIKPITDEELTLADLPTSFSRRDIEKLNESRRVLYEDHEKYIEEHKNDAKFTQGGQDAEVEKIRLEREKRIEKAKRELAKRKRNN